MAAPVVPAASAAGVGLDLGVLLVLLRTLPPDVVVDSLLPDSLSRRFRRNLADKVRFSFLLTFLCLGFRLADMVLATAETTKPVRTNRMCKVLCIVNIKNMRIGLNILQMALRVSSSE